MMNLRYTRTTAPGVPAYRRHTWNGRLNGSAHRRDDYQYFIDSIGVIMACALGTGCVRVQCSGAENNQVRVCVRAVRAGSAAIGEVCAACGEVSVGALVRVRKVE